MRSPAQSSDAEAYEPDALSAYLAQIGATPLLTAEEEVELGKRIEAGVYARHLVEQDPDRAGRAELEAVVADGQAARDHMIRANLRLVVAIAKRYAHHGLPLSDLIQEGNLGLIEAVRRFDHARGYKFSTCATWWIRKALQRGLEAGRAVRLPGHVLDEMARLTRAERTIAAALGRDPTEQDLARAIGQPVARVAALRRLAQESVSLDTPVRDGQRDVALIDLLEDPAGSTAESAVERQALIAALRSASTALAPRQAMIIRLRFGLDGSTVHTHQQIADRVGLSAQWVRQLEKESLARLRGHDRGRTLKAWAC